MLGNLRICNVVMFRGYDSENVNYLQISDSSWLGTREPNTRGKHFNELNSYFYVRNSLIQYNLVNMSQTKDRVYCELQPWSAWTICPVISHQSD